MKLGRDTTTKPDVLKVLRHTVPDDASGAGAMPVPPPGYADAGMTWRRMLRRVAVAEAAGMAILLGAGTIYGLEFFGPLAIGMVLFAGAALWIPRMSRAGTIFALVVSGLTLAMFGGMFFGWTGFLYPQSWFEMSFATLSTLLPIAGIVAAIAVLRHHDGIDAAKTPSRIVAAIAGLVCVVGIVGSATASDATRLPGDVTLTASNFEFEQTALTAKAGDVAIYFENDDPFAHNVKIEGHGTSKDAAGRQSIRHVFRGLTPGSYAFFCAIHTDMKGTLTVT